MNLYQRVDLLKGLGTYMASNDDAWLSTQEEASYQNGWFVPQFVSRSVQNIIDHYLVEEALQNVVAQYPLRQNGWAESKLGLVMAGNIPLVGFHDFMCAFLAGVPLLIKTSSKDEVLIKHLVSWLIEQNAALGELLRFSPQLKNCQAYIATGSNNSSRYFEHYFGKYPNIIRRNRTSLAVLTGNETNEELHLLADDLLCYFGLGCRNVSKILVPHHYGFEPLLAALEPFRWMMDHHKFRNNYDYNLALHLLNNKYYMTDGNVLVIENEQLFSPISQVNYSYYDNPPTKINLQTTYGDDLQAVVGYGGLAFGSSQTPGILDFADGIDTLSFLSKLS